MTSRTRYEERYVNVRVLSSEYCLLVYKRFEFLHIFSVLTYPQHGEWYTIDSDKIQ